jgi:hypothetical protein
MKFTDFTKLTQPDLFPSVPKVHKVIYGSFVVDIKEHIEER